jgi:hypothetical protein
VNAGFKLVEDRADQNNVDVRIDCVKLDVQLSTTGSTLPAGSKLEKKTVDQ